MIPAKPSKKSCWTCRIRRKKCDEGLPSCAICVRLEIECFRSDTKPEFMDGGPKEKQMSLEIGVVVKAKNDSLRRTRALEGKRRQRCQLQQIAKLSGKDTPASDNDTKRPAVERLRDFLISSSSPRIGLAPQPMRSSLNNHGRRDLTPEAVSCEPWVKDFIKEIRTISISKELLSSQPNETQSFQFEAKRLQNLLEAGIRESHLKCAELTAISPDHSFIPIEAEAYLRRIEVALLTCLFARAALMYLHIVLHGIDSLTLPATKKLVFEWTFTFRFVGEHTLLPHLVWPLCIAGCMATSLQQQQFFRETVTSSGISRLSPCMIWQALEIMEMFWKVPPNDRMQPRDLIWIRALDVLTDKILLE